VRSPAGAARQGRKLIRVLKATLKGPWRGAQRPTKRRSHTDQGATTSASDHARFSPRNGPPAQGDQRLRACFPTLGRVWVALLVGVIGGHDRVGPVDALSGAQLSCAPAATGADPRPPPPGR
jgi:hypothetical protein